MQRLNEVAPGLWTKSPDPPEPEAGGRKDDAGKTPFHLFPTDAMRAICFVLGFGARKYAPRNWEKGMDWSRVFAATIRHLTAWWEGEKYDQETGFSHLWHAGCCVIFLIAYEMRGVGTDDRPPRLRCENAGRRTTDCSGGSQEGAGNKDG